ncbi:Nif3-like dinuclear metal center hexameric protein [Paenibacillus sp. UNC451MF]|uniref:Nif3-like dinuclear metal center hexameric protein n=1 Tax=Paenibacillus sp. UNC451MF TaxID=1449063 RepID=UPI00048A5805|nr:Nif3-like dinuclear metal center hexameric protein [Paenibacillus sp. UNC451MF]
MDVEQFMKSMETIFGDLLTRFDKGEEYAFYEYGPKSIHRVGYATNITPEIVRQAADLNIDRILTHHDAWHFIYGMQEECHVQLKKHCIHHFFIHLPLDYADFGTCSSLFNAIGIDNLIQPSVHHEDRSIPGIGEYKVPIAFEELHERMKYELNEDVRAWKHSSKDIHRVGIVTGAGNSTLSIRDAHESGCDAYITGERTLYTILYAKYIGMNLIVGSHTFTELFGVRSLARKLKELVPYVEIIELKEEHFET